MNNSSLYTQQGLIVFIVLIIFAYIFVLRSYSRYQKKKKYIRKFEKEFGIRPEVPSKYNKEYIYEFIEATQNRHRYIDKNTAVDIDIYELFDNIEICKSAIGRDALFRALNQTDLDNKTKKNRTKLMDLFLNNSKLRSEIIYEYDKLTKRYDHNIFSFINTDHKYLFEDSVLIFLSFLPLVFVILGIVFNPLMYMIAVIDFFINLYFHIKTNELTKHSSSSINSIFSVLRLASVMMNKKNSELEFYTSELRKYSDIVSKIGKNNIFLIEDLNDTNVIYMYFQIFFLTLPRKYNKILKILNTQRERFLELIELLMEVEVAYSISSMTCWFEEGEITRATESDDVEFIDLHHPIIRDCVKNSFTDEKLLITGSNATGKSTYLKAVAISILFAENFGFCFAKSAKYRKGHIITSMGHKDSITSHKSYFMQEIERLKDIIDISKKEFIYILIDEILRGTNTIERIAASSSILKELAKSKSIILVATHDIELTHILDEYKKVHFSEYYEDEDIKFDYKLKEGASKTRNAINLLEYMGFDPQTVEESRKRIKNFEVNKTWITE